MRIRILHVVDNMGMGGLQNGLANLMGRLDPAGFEHVCCAMRPVTEADAQPLPANRVRSICLERHAGHSRIQVAALVRIIRRIKPNIVHSRNWGAIEAVVAARLAGSCSLVHSEHGFDTAANDPFYRTCFRRLAFELADRVVTVSHRLRDLHAKRTGFRAARIGVIHNGVDDRRFFPDPAARASVRRELGIADGELTIGCVGNFTPVKDHLTLFKAVELLAAACVNWRLLMVGDGPERARLEAFAAAHPGWRDRVLFVGRSKRVAELLNALDVYVLPSLTEGICNSLLEAMATGLPVLATNTDGNPEVVDGRSGLLFPVGGFRQLADHLLSLEARKEARLELGGSALRRVRQEFSIESMVRKYEELYVGLAPAAATAPAAAVEA